MITLSVLAISLGMSYLIVMLAARTAKPNLTNSKWFSKAGYYLFLAFVFIQCTSLLLMPICLCIGHYLNAIPLWYALGGNQGPHGPWRHIGPLMNLMEASLLLMLLSIPVAVVASVLRLKLKTLGVCLLLVIGNYLAHIQLHWLVD